MATLWQNSTYKTFYASWEEGGETRRQSLKTKDLVKARRRFNDFLRELSAGKITPITGNRLNIHRQDHMVHKNAARDAAGIPYRQPVLFQPVFDPDP